jgi:hypothetical protein
VDNGLFINNIRDLNMKRHDKFFIILLLAVLTCEVKPQTNFAWGRQFGSDKNDAGLNTAVDQKGNVFVAGNTEGNLSGMSIGKSDGFITKLDSGGAILWTKQFGTKENDKINWITLDRMGNIFLVGNTDGVSSKQSFGLADVWVLKVDSSGNIVWQQQYGSDSIDVGRGIYVNDQGDIFISGTTKGTFGKLSYGKADCFILKLNNNGEKIFIHQFGTAEDDQCNGIDGDASSDLYVCGGTRGDLSNKNKGEIDAILGQFTEKGEQIRIIQFGTESSDMATHSKIDEEGNIYIGGSTNGNLAAKHQGEGDCFLAKINKKGEMAWVRQFGTEKWDGILGLDMDEKSSGNIVVSGCQHWPECQSFIRMYKNDGTHLWTRNSVAAGKFGGTCGKGVCFDSKGNVYHTGLTGGNLFNTILGEHDVFVVKYETENNSAKP